MKKFNLATAMMMEMHMWICCMYMIFCTFLSDMFSSSKLKHFAA